MFNITVKKIFGLTLATMLMSSMVAGGVWAYFSDRETSSNSVLAAGTLDLSPTTTGTSSSGNYTITPGGDLVNGKVVFQKLQPGETGNITWVLADTGTIPGTLVLSSNVTFTRGGSTELKTAAGDTGVDTNGFLDEYLGVKLQRGVGTSQAAAVSGLTYLLGSSGNYASASNLEAALNTAGTALAAAGGNNTVVYVLNWELNSLFGAANPSIAQGDGGIIDVTFTLNQ